MHAHVHVLPRVAGDGVFRLPASGSELTPEEARDMSEKMVAAGTQ
jgi:diadenosine tetraphosphate (Ap4A) HIT family hydrolase